MGKVHLAFALPNAKIPSTCFFTNVCLFHLGHPARTAKADTPHEISCPDKAGDIDGLGALFDQNALTPLLHVSVKC